jgi:hypothetical protein
MIYDPPFTSYKWIQRGRSPIRDIQVRSSRPRSLAGRRGKKREAGLSSGLSVMRTNNGNCLVDRCDSGHTLPHHSIINCVKHTPTPHFHQVTSTGDRLLRDYICHKPKRLDYVSACISQSYNRTLGPVHGSLDAWRAAGHRRESSQTSIPGGITTQIRPERRGSRRTTLRYVANAVRRPRGRRLAYRSRRTRVGHRDKPQPYAPRPRFGAPIRAAAFPPA